MEEKMNENDKIEVVETSSSNTNTNSHQDFDEIFEKTTESQTHTNKKPKRKRKPMNLGPIKNKRNVLILSGCFLLAAVGGFGGTMVALHLNGGTGKTVLYQSVTNSSSSESSSDSETTSLSIKEVASATADSVVEITTETVSTNSFFPQAVTSGAGSGVILSTDGYIVTNNHVIEDANKVTVTTTDGTSYEATLIGTDSTTDLAVIKIDAEGLTPAVMGSSSELEVGDTVVAIGNPLGELGGTVTDGIISALDREITIDDQTMHLLQTNASINPGNSGGGLFNDQGELIGIVNAKSSGEDIEGLGFAIPIDRAKDIISSLIENGYVKGRAALGVSLQESTSIQNTAQVYIVAVEEGQAADKAGLQVGDQILKIDDTEVEGIDDVKSTISAHSAGDTITITILRKSETQEIQVTLGEATSTTTTTEQSQSN